MELVTRPDTFDVVVVTNLQGDIVSDLCAGLVGGLGFAPSANIGDHICIFEAVHGTAPDIAGKGIANPYAMIMSGQMLLEWLGARNDDRAMRHAARRIDTAVTQVLTERSALTADLGGPASTQQMGRAVAQACRSLSVTSPTAHGE